MLTALAIGMVAALAIYVALMIALVNRELTCHGCGHEFGPHEHMTLEVGTMTVHRYCDRCAEKGNAV